MGEILIVESGILGSGIQNTAQGIENPANDWNPESKIHWEEFRSPESMAWYPEDCLGPRTINNSTYLKQYYGARTLCKPVKGVLLVILIVLFLNVRDKL